MNEAKKEMQASKDTIERLTQENEELKKRIVEVETGGKTSPITAMVSMEPRG